MADEKKRQMPVLLIQPGTMSRKDILRAERQGGICVVECKEPESARFVDPPLGANLDEQARAAMFLARHIIAQRQSATVFYHDLVHVYVNALMKPPMPAAPPVERVQKKAPDGK